MEPKTESGSNAFNSPIFGKTREPTDKERAAIRKLIDEVPVGVFQELNKALNERGLMITIDAHPAARN